MTSNNHPITIILKVHKETAHGKQKSKKDEGFEASGGFERSFVEVTMVLHLVNVLLLNHSTTDGCIEYIDIDVSNTLLSNYFYYHLL